MRHIPRDGRCADSGFLDTRKAQALHGGGQGGEGCPLRRRRNEGRRNGGVDLLTPVDHGADLLHVALNLLGVLRANEGTLAAQHALVLPDVGLIVVEGDGLHIAVTDALIAVFAVGFLQLNDAHASALRLCVGAGDNFFLHQAGHAILIHMMELHPVNAHTGAVLALAHAEAGGKLHLVGHAGLLQFLLEQLGGGVGALHVVGGTHASAAIPTYSAT